MYRRLQGLSNLAGIINGSKSVAAYSPDGTTLAIGHGKTVTISSSTTLAAQKTLKLPSFTTVKQVAFDPGDPRKLSIKAVKPLLKNNRYLWDTTQAKTTELSRDEKLPVYIRTIGEYNNANSTMCVQKDSHDASYPFEESYPLITFSGTNNGTLCRYWKVPGSHDVHTATFSADGNIIALVGKKVEVFEKKKLEIEGSLTPDSNLLRHPPHACFPPLFITPESHYPIEAATLSPDGNYLITATKQTTIEICFWDITNKKIASRIKTPLRNVYDLTMNPDGKQLFISDEKYGYVIILQDDQQNNQTLNEQLSKLTLRQFELMEGFAQAIKDRARIHPDNDQWETFQSLPQDFQEKLQLYIKAPESVNNNNTTK